MGYKLIEEYQLAVHLFKVENEHTNTIEFDTIGLAGEAGEVCNVIKKITYYPTTTETAGHLLEELGDVLFHVVAVGRQYGFSLSDIIETNIGKLDSIRNQKNTGN